MLHIKFDTNILLTRKNACIAVTNCLRSLTSLGSTHLNLLYHELDTVSTKFSCSKNCLLPFEPRFPNTGSPPNIFLLRSYFQQLDRYRFSFVFQAVNTDGSGAEQLARQGPAVCSQESSHKERFSRNTPALPVSTYNPFFSCFSPLNLASSEVESDISRKYITVFVCTIKEQ